MIPNTKENREKYIKRLDDWVHLYFKSLGSYGSKVPARNVDWKDPDVLGFVMTSPGITFDVTEEEDRAWDEIEKRMDTTGADMTPKTTGADAKWPPEDYPDYWMKVGDTKYYSELFPKWQLPPAPKLTVTVEGKYSREIKPGVYVDVYDVLKAFNVTNPALQHLIKKALACGLRGHKDKLEDLDDIVISAKRARELGI